MEVSTCESQNRMTIVDSNIEEAILMLEQYGAMKENFLQTFDIWTPSRKRNVDKLLEVANNLEAIHQKGNIARATASAGGIVSGALGLTDSILTLNSGSQTSWLKDISGIGGKFFSLLGAGTSVTEVALSWALIMEAKRLLQKERKHLSKIEKFLDHTEILIRAVNEICELGAIRDVFKKLQSTTRCVKLTCKEFSSQVTHVVKEVSEKYKNLSPSFIEKIIHLCNSLLRHPEIFLSIKSIFVQIKGDPVIVPLSTTLVKVLLEINFRESSKLSISNLEDSQRVAITCGLVQVVHVAVDLFSLIIVVGDIEKGSKSQYASMIRDVRDKLQHQFELISTVYEILKDRE